LTDRVSVGRVGRPHGIAGAFFVEDASDDPKRFRVGASLHVAGEAAKIVESKRSAGRPVVRLDREAPRGAELEVDRAALPPPKPGEYYVFQLVGLDVESATTAREVKNVERVSRTTSLKLDSGLLLLVEACVRGRPRVHENRCGTRL
jgi:ribosomal 30S subunit maturation factor RimM